MLCALLRLLGEDRSSAGGVVLYLQLITQVCAPLVKRLGQLLQTCILLRRWHAG